MGSNKKAGQRRLVDMSATVDDLWRPDLPPVEEVSDVIRISASASYLIRYSLDEYRRMTDWAVVQRYHGGDVVPVKVAHYDACHGKGVHVHVYNLVEIEVDQHALNHHPIRSYTDLDSGLDYAVGRVTVDWQENERRSGHVR